jgi:hypothetical protein
MMERPEALSALLRDLIERAHKRNAA